MTKVMGRPAFHTSSIFARWMAEMGYTNDQASAALGMSVARVRELRRGASYTTGDDATPDARTLLAMAAIKAGLPPYAPSNDAQP
jgi:hypothetical protein